MPFQLPSFRDILTRAQNDLAAYSDGTVPRRSVEHAIARAIAGLSKGLYGYQKYTQTQAFPDTAEDTHFWHWMAVYGLEQKQAVPTQILVELTGTDGTIIDDETQVQRPDGALYILDNFASVAVDGGIVQLAATAVSPGRLSNSADGQQLSLSLPVGGIDPECSVVDTLVSGSDLETVEDGHIRLLQHLRTPPSGGGPGDYVRWALLVPGVTRAWEFANLVGPNSVAVAAVRDEDGTGTAIIPDSGERAEILTSLQENAPITVTTSVITLTGVPLDLVFSVLSPNTLEVRNAIVESVTDLLEREAEPNGTLLLSRINEAISGAAGEVNHALSAPVADITYTTSQIGVMGSLTPP